MNRKRKTTTAGREHMAQVARLGCIICGWPAEIHHLRTDPRDERHYGMGQKAPDTVTIPLCHLHHRAGGIGVAYHACPRTWQAIHGRETDLWRVVMRQLGLEVAA